MDIVRVRFGGKGVSNQDTMGYYIKRVSGHDVAHSGASQFLFTVK